MISLEKILLASRALLLNRERLTLERFTCVAREGIKELTHRFVYAVLLSAFVLSLHSVSSFAVQLQVKV